MRRRSRKQKKLNTARYFIYVVLFCISVSIFLAYQLNKNEKNYIETYTKEQQILVDEVASKAQEYLSKDANVNINLAENNVVDNILKKSVTSGNRYWIFGKEDKLIFNRDDETSKDTKDTKFQDIIKSDEIMSVTNFNVNKTNYFIGMCTNKSYVISSLKLNKLNIYIFIFVGSFSFALIIIMIGYSLKIKSDESKIAKQKKELQEKNIMIQSLTSSDRGNSYDVEENWKLNRYALDHLTKTYNREFLKKLLGKINSKRNLDVIAIIFSIQGYNAIEDDKLKDDVASSTADIINEEKDKKHVVSRINDAQFALIMLDCNINKAKTMANMISLKFKDKFGKLDLELLYGAAEKNTSDGNTYSVISDAIDEIKIFKI